MSDKEESPLKPVGADDRPASRPAAREGGLSATQTKSTARNGVGGSGEDEEKPKDSKLKVFWNKLGLDAPTMVIMIKGSVPPVVAIAMYQADAVATHFRTLGYLIASRFFVSSIDIRKFLLTYGTSHLRVVPGDSAKSEIPSKFASQFDWDLHRCWYC